MVATTPGLAERIDTTGLWVNHVELLMREGDWGRAIAEAEAGLHTPTPIPMRKAIVEAQLYRRLGVALTRVGRFAEAEAALAQSGRYATGNAREQAEVMSQRARAMLDLYTAWARAARAGRPVRGRSVAGAIGRACHAGGARSLREWAC